MLELNNLSDSTYKSFMLIILIIGIYTGIIIIINNIIHKYELDRKHDKKISRTKSFKDILDIPIEEIQNIMEDLRSNPKDNELFLKIIKTCYSEYSNKDNDFETRLKAAERLDAICSCTGYYSIQVLYDFIDEIKKLK